MKKSVLPALILVSAAVAAGVGLYFYWREEVGERKTPWGSAPAQESGASARAVSASESHELPVSPPADITAKSESRTARREVEPSPRREAGPARRKELEPRSSASELVAAWGDAVARGDAAAASAPGENVANSPDMAAVLQGLLTDRNGNDELRRFAADALARSGSQEAVEWVLDQLLAARWAGDLELAETLQEYVLTAATSVEGARALFDLLLGAGRYAGIADALPDDLRSALRKAIRLAPDQEAIGNLAARYYLDSQAGGRNEALVELFDGVAHPGMFAVLAAMAYQAGAPSSANRFLDRLARTGDQATGRAFVHAAAREPGLLNEAAQRLYVWSLEHEERAQPGVFLEYITDSTRSPVERVAAAYGLAGIADAREAVRALSKAMSHEEDPAVKTHLSALRGLLERMVHAHSL